jgi:GT2 family glycosyltransferase/glycosyltransferase involved in cell wall biosynthesis
MPPNLSLFDTRRSPYYILASDFRHSSAGIRNLHYLCHALNELGYEAYIAGATVTSNYLRTPLLDIGTEERHFISGRIPIAVYPEVTSGNPFNAPVVARWLLNIPGHLAGDIQFSENDLIFYHLPWCLPEGLKGHPLYVPSVDTRIFNNDDNLLDPKRSGFCRYARKFLEFGGEIRPEHKNFQSLGHEIDLTPEEIASTLRRSEALYCYERSAIIQEAMACGCPVLNVESDYWNIQPYEVSEPGIEIDRGAESLSKAKSEIGNTSQILRDGQAQALIQIQQFAELTQAEAQKTLASKANLSQLASLHDYWLLSPTERLKQINVFRQFHSKYSIFSGANDNSSNDDVTYKTWIARRSLLEIDTKYFSEHVSALWKQHPLFEFVLVLQPGQEAFLADTIDSLSQQFFTGWRLSIFAQSPSPDPEFESDKSNVQWTEVKENQSFANAINQKILCSKANWIGFFECGTHFSQQLLLVCGDYSATHPDWRLIYTDEDAVSHESLRQTPQFKPDLNPDLLRSTDYIGSFFVAKEAFIAAGGYSRHTGGEKYDIALRILDACGESSIGHIPDVLYHVPDSVTQQANDEAATRSLQDHFERRQIKAEIHPGLVPGKTRRINYLHTTTPKVSIIIPNRNRLDLLGPCIESLLSRTQYPDWEILIVDNGSDDPAVPAYYQALSTALPERVRILSAPDDFNFSAMNNLAAHESCGEYLLLLNNDTVVLNADWLDVMMSHAQRPEIGVVGARLLTADAKQVQDAGMVLGMNGTAGHVFGQDQSPEQAGYMLRALADQNYSAVSGACLLVRKSLYQTVKGFDEEAFRLSNGDVDLCLKIQEMGYRIVWTPFATLIHHGSASVDTEPAEVKQRRTPRLQQEAHQLAKRWLPKLANDPAWNRNLSLSSTNPVTEGELVVPWNQDFRDRPRLLWMPLSSQGQAEYRTFAPMRALHESGLAQCAAICQPKPNHPDRTPTPIELARLAPDTLIMHTPVDDVRCIGLLHYKEINSAVLRVYSLDDLITNIPTGSYVHKKLPSARMIQRLRLGLAASDRLIVSTEPLAEACRGMIEDIRLLPNTLEWKVWGKLQPARRRGEKLRVGWAGAQQHAADLRFMLDVVKATSEEVDWVFFGMMPNGASAYVKEFHEFVHRFADYPEKLASLDLDLAVAPLEIHPFNEAKSNLRLLEYGILGWPVICTDIFPYRTDAPPVTCLPNDAGKWIEAIRERVGQTDALAREGDALREWVKTRYLLENNLDNWMTALIR